MADPVTQPNAVPSVSPGWKTTEMYALMLLMGGLGWAGSQLVSLLPVLATSPGMPPWMGAVVPLAIAGLGWAAKQAWSEYANLRTQLKLGADPSAAGAQAAVDPSKQLNA